MKFENTYTANFEGAIRGMRLPMNSGDRSDSYWKDDKYIIGKNDLDLIQRLIKGGTEHRKVLRTILVSVDITAPMVWWSQADTYKVGTTASSTSKMHKLAATLITLDCFETDDYENVLVEDTTHLYLNDVWEDYLNILESLRLKYLETKDKKYWKELIRLLPESWLQTRTWTANYEVVRNMVHQRQGHKLTEWESFINWAHSLPYADELIFFNN